MLDLEGDLTSSNGADRTNAFNACMAANDPGVKVLKEPTNWTDATAVTDAQNAINAYGSQLKAIYSQWSAARTPASSRCSRARAWAPARPTRSS